MPTNANSPIAPARPEIRIAGQVDTDLANGLLYLEVAERSDGLARCEALFGNWGGRDGGTGFLYNDRRKLDFGKAVEIRLGPDKLFTGRIMALEGRYPEGVPPQIAIYAEDKFQDLRMTRRSRSFPDLSDADIMARVASDHGLTPRIDVSGPTHRLLAQVNQSDLAFLRDRARAIGAEIWVDGDELHAAPRASRTGGTPLELAYGARLREFRVVADLAMQRSSFAVAGWDVGGKQAIRQVADAGLLQSELNQGDSGPSILGQALGTRDETLAHGIPLSADEARARAEAMLRLFGRRFVVGRGIAEPDARLRVGSQVTLGGLGDLFDGTYYVAESRHLFDNRLGFRTEFAVERPGLGRPQG